MELRYRFNERLKHAHQMILDLGKLVTQSIQRTIVVLENKDTELAQKVIDEDQHIDLLQKNLEDFCTILISTENPVATDVRDLLSLIKVAAFLERIGDHARHLCLVVPNISTEVLQKYQARIREMCTAVISMVDDSLVAFVSRDEEKARSTAEYDQTIDNLHNMLYHDIIRQIKNDPSWHLEESTELLMIIRVLERMGDHVANISECTIYIKTGEHVDLN